MKMEMFQNVNSPPVSCDGNRRWRWSDILASWPIAHLNLGFHHSLAGSLLYSPFSLFSTFSLSLIGDSLEAIGSLSVIRVYLKITLDETH